MAALGWHSLGRALILGGMGALSTGQPIVISSCFDSTYAGNANVSCPANCNVAASCESGTTRCIRSQDCPVIFTGGRSDVSLTSKGVCYNCKVPGCASCANDKLCMVCQPNFDLDGDGKCLWKHRETWHWAWVAIGVIVVSVLVDFVFNCCLPNRNPDAVQHGLLHRQAAKVRNLSVEGEPLFPLCVNVHRQQICGPGMVLFFNWFILLFCIALWLALISGIFYVTGATADAHLLHTLCDSVVPLNISEPSSALVISDTAVSCNSKWLTAWTGLAYVGSVVLTAIFCICQDQLWQRMKHDHDSVPILHPYTIEASGFPADATDPEELKTWWQAVVDEVVLDDCEVNALGSHLPLSKSRGVVEVSVAYNFADKTDEVTRLLDDHLYYEDRLHAGGAADKSDYSREDLFDETEHDMPWQTTFWTQILSFGMLGTDLRFGRWTLLGGSDPTPPAVLPQRKEELLRQELAGTGEVIVVFDTQELAAKLLQYFEEWGSLPQTWQGSEISITANESEPTEINWQNFGITREVHRMRILKSCFIVPLVVAVWGALYYPWATFSLHAGSGANTMIVFFSDQFLSGMIAIGNCIVGYAAALCAQWYGFRHAPSMRKQYLLIIVPGVALNVVVDVVITWMVIYQEQANLDAFKGQPAYFWSYGLDQVFNAMYSLLFPSYVIVPYVFEPLFTIAVPYWLGVWRVKSDKSISRQHAERIMIAPEIDIINPPYVDMICTSSVFFWTLWCPHSKHWTLFLFLAFWAAFLYWQNRVRMLRWQTRSFFGSAELHKVQMYLWSMPLGILAGTYAAHWADCHMAWRRTFFGIGACLTHIAVHCLVWRMLQVRMNVGIDDEPYSEAIARHPTPATYLNTNPIEVLKSRMNTNHLLSRYLPTRKPLIYYTAGKDYLQVAGSKPYFGEVVGESCCGRTTVEEPLWTCLSMEEAEEYGE